MKKQERVYTEKQVDGLCESIRYNERQWDLFDKGTIKIKPKSYDELIIQFKKETRLEA
jgi:hypothetical protein